MRVALASGKVNACLGVALLAKGAEQVTGRQSQWRMRGVALRPALAVPREGGAQVLVSDQRSQWPALWLTGLGTPWNTIRAEGQLALTSAGFGLTWVHGRLRLQGGLTMDALDIASRMSTLRPMGSYRFVLAGGDTPVLTLSTTQGSLQLSGKGQWTDGRLRFDGEASATPERQDALTNLLNIIGRRQGARSIIKVG
jgi:general secretion pathway protein N